MFISIPTWSVTVYTDKGNQVFRVSETDLDPFLRVLTFNKHEFRVTREGYDPRIQQRVAP